MTTDNQGTQRATRPLRATALLAGMALVMTGVFFGAAPRSALAASTLGVGDISILSQDQISADEGFSFVAWVDLATGCEIKFGNQWFDGTSFSAGSNGDPTITWTATSAVSAGTVISIGGNPVAASSGTAVSTTGNINLNFGGDVVWAYQGTLTTSSLIFGLLVGPAWGHVRYNLPTELNVPFGNAQAPKVDIGAQYVGPRTGLDADGYRTAIALDSNWGSMATGGHNVTPFNVPVVVNAAPTADAGSDQSIHAGDTVTLDGSGSIDDNTASGDLSYAWTLTTPAGSTATLSSASATGPTFTADKTGTYTATLVVTDAGSLASTADSAVISSVNMAPSVDAGVDLTSTVDVALTITGTATDPEADTLAYAWAIITAPTASAATLSDDTTLTPGFTPDEVGVYVLSLVASDPYDDAMADTMVLTVLAGDVSAEDKLKDACDVIRGFARSDFDNKKRGRKMCKEIRKILRDLRGNKGKSSKCGKSDKSDKSNKSGLGVNHTRRLRRLIARTDGCALRGEIDTKASGATGRNRDWIVDCDAQDELYPLLKAALDTLDS